MVALLMLKHIRNISDESVVEQWSENAYYQYFSGEAMFVAAPPCEASELVHFRKRKASKVSSLFLTIVGRLVRELEHNLSPQSFYQPQRNLCKSVLAQKHSDSNKIYSLHSTDVQCISKGKEHTQSL